MIVVGLMLLGLALIGFASSALDDDPDARWFDALLFVLILISAVHAKKRKENDDE